MSPSPLQKTPAEVAPAPFADFAPPVRPQSTLRQAITDRVPRPETECLPPFSKRPRSRGNARRGRTNGPQAGSRRCAASTAAPAWKAWCRNIRFPARKAWQLMCLAEALLRIPDTATRDALIRDKIADGNWKSHLGGSRSLFVNAATWGLVVTGKLTSTVNDRSLSAALTRLISRCGEPVIRRGVDMAMRMMANSSLPARPIQEALKRSKELEEKGFRYSYDMLGEAATTAADAERYYRITRAPFTRSAKPPPAAASMKPRHLDQALALHPRYSRAQAARVMGELLPKVKSLALLAKNYDIASISTPRKPTGWNCRSISLEELCLDGELSGWNGMGFVVQAYGKRCPFVLDFIIDLARRSGRRIMVRLVKGAYWDAEIKRAQLDGLADFRLHAQDPHRRLLYRLRSQAACRDRCGLPAIRDTHAPDARRHLSHGRQGLSGGQIRIPVPARHGRAPLRRGRRRGKLDRPCRIYAPVGTHETLLAYLVRRLLENGAKFLLRASHQRPEGFDRRTDRRPRRSRPRHAGRRRQARQDRLAGRALRRCATNSAGSNLSNEETLASLTEALKESAAMK